MEHENHHSEESGNLDLGSDFFEKGKNDMSSNLSFAIDDPKQYSTSLRMGGTCNRITYPANALTLDMILAFLSLVPYPGVLSENMFTLQRMDQYV